MWGKVIGGVVGFLIGGPLLAIVAIFIGHGFDKNRATQVTPQKRAAIEQCFFDTTFSLLGYLAKADGRISKSEIAITEKLIDEMGLSSDQRSKAIDLFKKGSASNFTTTETLAAFKSLCGTNRNLVQMLLSYLINLAFADGVLDPAEEQVLREIAEGLGINSIAFEKLLQMIKAQDTFKQGGGQYYSHQGRGQTSQDELAQAYIAVGVDASATDAEVKKAYRKLMSQYHPDKLSGQGLPEDAVKAATERSQEIQVAYDVIKKARAKER